MRFRSHWIMRYWIFTECILFFAIFLAVAVLILVYPNSSVSGNLLYSILTVVIVIAYDGYFWYFFMIRGTLWTRVWARLFITESEIQWSCPCLRSHKLLLSECAITVEHEHTPQGSHFIYICFSKFPNRKLANVGQIRCSDSFIKFWYSKELCEYLIGILPEMQARPLVYQLELDRKEQAEEEKKKRKKKARKR